MRILLISSLNVRTPICLLIIHCVAAAQLME